LKTPFCGGRALFFAAAARSVLDNRSGAEEGVKYQVGFWAQKNALLCGLRRIKLIFCDGLCCSMLGIMSRN
jgi:hypothetical protein